MKISTQSWHYKMVNKIFNYPSKSLCIYFWQIPYSAIVCAVCGIVMLTVIVGMVGTVLVLLAQPVALNIWHVPVEDTLALGLLSTVVWGAVFKGLNEHFSAASWNKVLFKVKTKPRKEKKPSLLLAYLKAKKDKVCPLIEFEWS